MMDVTTVALLVYSKVEMLVDNLVELMVAKRVVY
jgi:hypothetical protein